MSLPELIFLCAAVSAFTLYGVALFAAWLVVEVFAEPGGDAARPAAAIAAEPVQPQREAA